jgi:hypothetical protein
VLALAAPASGQYVQQNVSLARFDARQPQLADQAAEVRLASAETGETVRPDAAPAPTATATPMPQRAIAPAPIAARPEVRRASLLIAPEAPAPAKVRTAVERPRNDADRVVRVASRDEVRPGPHSERARPAATREERVRPGPRDERRPAPVRTAARDERRPALVRATTRAAVAPGAAGRILAQRPARELRKTEAPNRRRSTRD